MDSTASKALKKCPRYYFLRIVLGRVPLKQKNQVVLDFGTYYHKFRELLELKDYNTALAAMINYDPDLENAGKYKYLDRLRLIETCKEAYKYREKEMQGGRIKVLAVEQPFNIQMPDGSFIGGRADQIVSWNGKIYGRDFKTTSKAQMFFERELDPNDQCMRYIYSESQLHGTQVQGIIFEAVMNTATTGPKIFPVISSRNKMQIDSWINDQMMVNKVLTMYRDNDIWPMHETYQCSFCDMANVCRQPNEASMVNLLKTSYKHEPWDHQKVTQGADSD
jgi:hypothetical protein